MVERGAEALTLVRNLDEGKSGLSHMKCVLEKILGEFQKESQAVVSDMEKSKSPHAHDTSFNFSARN